MDQQLTQEMPPIDEIVGFLDETSPTLLQQFRSRYPQFQTLLQKGSIAGPRKDRTTEELSLRISIATSVLEGAVSRCQTELSLMRKRIKTADRLQVVSQCLTFGAGASILTTVSDLWAAAEPAVKLFSGFAAVASGVLMLIVHNLEGRRSRRGPGILERYEKLASYQSLGEELAKEIKLRANGDPSAAVPTVRKINALCSDIRRLTSLYL